VELRQLNPAVAVRGPHHGEVGTDAVELTLSTQGPSFVASPSSSMPSFREERLVSLEIVDNDENVVHPLTRHIPAA
jgi:hypothetical protein